VSKAIASSFSKPAHSPKNLIIADLTEFVIVVAKLVVPLLPSSVTIETYANERRLKWATSL
jgi:hypothetical protein